MDGFFNWDILPAYLPANSSADWKSSYTQNDCRMFCECCMLPILPVELPEKTNTHVVKMAWQWETKKSTMQHNKKNETVLSYISAV